MATYDIQSINFMTSGNKRGIVSFNLRCNDKAGKYIYLLDRTFENGSELSDNQGQGIITESGKYRYLRTDYIANYKSQDTLKPLAQKTNSTELILNEKQRHIDIESLSGSLNYNSSTKDSDISANPPQLIQILREKDYEQQEYSVDDYTAYNESLKNIRMDLIFETNFDEEGKSQVYYDSKPVYALYDIKDLMLKSKKSKYEINSRIPKCIGQSKLETSNNNTQDIYYDFQDYPQAYCQYSDSTDSYSFILTKLTSKNPYYLYFQEKENSLIYHYKLDATDIQTNLYKFAQEYGYSTYSEFLKTLDEVDYSATMSVFSAYHKISGIKYNYAIQLSESGKKTKDSQLNYNDGNMPFNDMFITKNTYNPLYSVQMSSDTGIDDCREYCDLQYSGNKIFVKYYDNKAYTLGYNIDNSDGTKTNYALIRDKYGNGLYPYQKVETMAKTNTSKITSHKSNLFSIKIQYSGMNEENDEQNTSNMVSKIRTDIRNNIREFVEHICPANTQLFDTYFI